VNLPAWLVAHGFHVAPVQADTSQLAMSDRYGETLHLRKDAERDVWSYSNPEDAVDKGTVVDLIVRRDACTLDACLNRLAACFDRSNRSQEALAYRDALLDRENILHRSEARLVAALKVEEEAARGLEGLGVARGTLDEWRFGRPSTILRDPKSLEHSQFRRSDREIVFVERPIDAVAYERVYGQQRACYVYTGDNPGPETRRKISHVLADAPKHLRVVLAFARDSRGSEIAAHVASLDPSRGFERRPPEFGGRWADQMQIEERHRRSLVGRGRKDVELERFRGAVARALDAGIDQAAIRTAITRREGPRR
jgi:hypothetical protein